MRYIEHQKKKNKKEFLLVKIKKKIPELYQGDKLLKAVRERLKITCKYKPIRTREDFCTQTLKTRQALNEVFQGLKR